MTDEQRRQMRDIENRAQPFFQKLVRVEDRICDLRERLFDALDEKKKIEAQLSILSDEKDELWAEFFATKKTRKAVDSITVAVYNSSV